MRILVVDDEPDVLMLCRVNLQHAGHEIAEAADGAAALATAAAWHPDMIVLDVMLPGMDGFAVLEALRAVDTTRDTPVVLLTAKTLPEDQIRGWNAGANGYLTKPFSPVDLTSTIDGLAGTSPEERSHRRARALTALGVRV
jgi:DNA-binding response OmpR family regulator